MSILNVTSRDPGSDLVTYYLYISEGFIIAFLNAIIVLTILRHARLRARKEYWVVGGLALSDVLHSLGFLSAGFHRIWLILAKKDKEPVTAWDCMRTTHNLLFIFASPLSSVMLSCCSLDRLIAMSDPLRYFAFKRYYAFLLVGAFYALAAGTGLGAIYLSHESPRVAEFSRLCFTTWAIPSKLYQKYFWGVQFVGGLMAVVLYVFVIIVYKQKRNEIEAARPDMQVSDNEKKNQRRLMKTLGCSTIFTAIFFVSPNLIQMLFVDMWPIDFFAYMIPYQGVVININALLNVFLYTFRHRDIREGLFCLVTCQEMSNI